MGCAIRRPEGNLLIEYGFERDRPPEAGCSRYPLRQSARRVLVLRGFGFFPGRSLDSGIYVNRF